MRSPTQKQHSELPRQHTINARGILISLDIPVVMGILNLTPDSFHSGSRIRSVDEAVTRTGRMLEDGAAIIDIGGASSRPGAEVISPDEELDRLMPVLEKLILAYPDAVFSVDTWRTKVAAAALEAGARMINDITTGGMEPEIIQIVAKAGAPYIAMHMLGTPGNMPGKPEYEDLPGDILRFFVRKIRDLRDAGISDVLIDPGFGFGKSVQQNFQLLKSLSVFRFLEVPLVVGVSRKSMVWRTLDISPEEALNGTTAIHMVALQQGANILRAHDVREAREVIEIFCRI